MNQKEIINTLRYNEGFFPEEAILAADHFQTELIPIFLQELQVCADDPERLSLLGESYFLHIYAAMFLAKWRVKEAFPILINVFSGDPEMNYVNWGDCITEEVPTFLASTFNGDYQTLADFIHNTKNGDFERSAAVNSLIPLVREGELDRQKAIDLLNAWFDFYVKAHNPSDHMATSITCVLTDLAAAESFPYIKNAFNQGIIDNIVVDLAFVEKHIHQAWKDANKALESHTSHRFVTSIVQQMKWWSCFREDEESALDGKLEMPWGEFEAPYIAPPKIGRNDLCPCGSGKKYKKCCL